MQMHTYQSLLEVSQRVNWRVDDIIGGDKILDFSRPFLPETFARVTQLPFLTPREQLALNHIRAHGYLAMFELVEESILPFVTEQVEKDDGRDPHRGPALKQFALEEAKHIELFKRFKREFADRFGIACGFIGPPEAIRAELLSHGKLAMGIAILGIEWMSQGHYVESIRDDGDLDPQFKSLLKHHWVEEAQHARLDALMVQSMAKKRTPEEIEGAIDEYFAIGGFLDGGLKTQAELDLDSFTRATGRVLDAEQRAQFLEVQHQALRWTFLGTAMRNKNFLENIGAISANARKRIEEVAPVFC
jgi:hypothetical protein